MKNSLERSARLLRLLLLGALAAMLSLYLLARTGLGGAVVVARASAGSAPSAPGLWGDFAVLLLTAAMLQASRLLGLLARGEGISLRLIRAFKAVLLWLLVLTGYSIAAPIAKAVIAHTAASGAARLSLPLELADVLQLMVTLTLFLIARLLERARALEEEMAEIV